MSRMLVHYKSKKNLIHKISLILGRTVVNGAGRVRLLSFFKKKFGADASNKIICDLFLKANNYM